MRLEGGTTITVVKVDAYFNTSKVRLEGRLALRKRLRTARFQYLEGAIRGIARVPGVVNLVTFQYLEGAIRGPQDLQLFPPQTDFNTSKVRLEVVSDPMRASMSGHFNTSKVRLEDGACDLREVGGGFQYLEGAIRGRAA